MTTRALEILATWVLAILWVSPLVYAVWTAFHAGEYATHFVLMAPLTLENFARAWEVAPDVLLVANYRMMARLGLVDTIFSIALPYLGSAFGIFLLRQTFRTVP